MRSGVQVDGIVVPGLTTRRVNTQVEVEFGQSLIVGMVSADGDEPSENVKPAERLNESKPEHEEKLVVFVVTPHYVVDQE